MLTVVKKVLEVIFLDVSTRSSRYHLREAVAQSKGPTTTCSKQCGSHESLLTFLKRSPVHTWQCVSVFVCQCPGRKRVVEGLFPGL